MRKLLAVLLGVAVASFAVMGVETLGQVLFPPPADLDASDPGAIEAYIAAAPLGALASVLIAWAAGALVGSLVAARISDGPHPQRAGMLVGAVLFVMAILTMFTIPHPVWFVALSPVACLLPATVGAMLGSRRR